MPFGAPPQGRCVEGLLLEDELAAIVGEAHPRQEGHAEQVHAQRPLGMDDRGHIAHHDVADLDHAQLHQRGARYAVRRPILSE